MFSFYFYHFKTHLNSSLPYRSTQRWHFPAVLSLRWVHPEGVNSKEEWWWCHLSPLITQPWLAGIRVRQWPKRSTNPLVHLDTVTPYSDPTQPPTITHAHTHVHQLMPRTSSHLYTCKHLWDLNVDLKLKGNRLNAQKSFQNHLRLDKHQQTQVYHSHLPPAQCD